jgi:Protein of unknown function (DUF1822)
MLSVISTLAEIYSQHVFIQLELSDLDAIDSETCLNRVDLNQLCADSIQKWLNTNTELAIESAFPCQLSSRNNLKFIAKLVNGFVLHVGTTRIVFIPSETIDLEEFEVHQEWIDLPNWAADYYVPVQVDLEQQYLHLWGFISYADLTAQATLDPIFRTYHVNAAHTIANLDLLQANYELSGLKSVPMRTEITPVIDRLSSTEAAESIERLQQHDSQLSPRLDLSFPIWGAILNEPQWLERYQSPHHQRIKVPHHQVTHLSALLKQVTMAIGNRWRTVEESIDPSPLSPAWRSNSARLRSRLRPNHFRGIPLTTPAEIKLAIAHLYESQSDLPTPSQITGSNDLIPLIHHSPLETVRWKAVEYLRSIEPNHPILPTQPILDLGIGFQGEEIALVVSTIEKLDRSLAISIQLYPIGESDRLPSGLELSLKDEHGEPVLEASGKPYVATVRADALIGRIQLYFVADRDERFSACIRLDETQIVEEFRV